MIKDPKVSIVMLTYNHSDYIHQSIKSVLNQNTNFSYEIVIGDDCSEDSTQEILKDYEKEYPGIFRLELRKKNIGPTRNLHEILLKCRGKYVALLEGDDFWSDDKKLLKQIDILEKSEYIGVVHNINVLTENEKLGKKIVGNYHVEDKQIYSFNDYGRRSLPGHTSTLCFRNIFLDKAQDYSIIYKADKNTGDRTLNLILLLKGDIYCLGDQMSVYRVIRSENASNINSLYFGKNMLLLNWKYINILNDYSEKEFNKKFIDAQLKEGFFKSALLFFIKSKKYKDFLIMCFFYKELQSNIILVCFKMTNKYFNKLVHRFNE